jgi:glycosyltransferase involved in cell wall biosynthesis
MIRGGSPDFGINIVGHVSGNLGLGVLARHIVSVLLARACPVRILDIDPGLGRGGHDRRFAEYTVSSVDELSHPVTLLIFPPDSIVTFLKDRRNRGLLFRSEGLNAALINWEQMTVPSEWTRSLQGLDVIVAPSEFTRATFEKALPDVPVLSMSVPLELPEPVTADRVRFGLQPHAVWFGCAFEPFSDPVRKNPFAVLDAFERALPARSDVGLVVKVNNAVLGGRPHPVVEDLRARSRRDRRIVLLEDSLEYARVLSFYASLDVYVSLHRSEGIGLGLMEAMSLGKPVMATGWSGNMSFMDRSNSCVVAYQLVQAQGTSHVYSKKLLGPRAVWANPDVGNAAEWMRVLVERPDARAIIGRNARESMGRYQKEAQRALFVDELRSILESEVSWGVGAERRKARRDCLERAMDEAQSENNHSGPAWVRTARSLAKKAGFRRGKFPYWTPPQRRRTS